jgi:hypothetical protein
LPGRLNIKGGPAKFSRKKGWRMRDLLFKNLTSNDKQRKVLASSEIFDKSGVRTIVRRHFIYFVREVTDNKIEKQEPYLFIVKERNTKEKRERFYCRIKGSVYAVYNNRIYLVRFMHSLKINLIAIPEGSIQYSEE